MEQGTGPPEAGLSLTLQTWWWSNSVCDLVLDCGFRPTSHFLPHQGMQLCQLSMVLPSGFPFLFTMFVNEIKTLKKIKRFGIWLTVYIIPQTVVQLFVMRTSEAEVQFSVFEQLHTEMNLYRFDNDLFNNLVFLDPLRIPLPHSGFNLNLCFHFVLFSTELSH